MKPKTIKRLRLKLGLSREELAVKVGVSVFSIARWESGTSKPMRYFARQLEIILREGK